MKMTLLTVTVLSIASTVAVAQQEPAPAMPPAVVPPPAMQQPAPSPSAPVPGANSFTEEQARGRIADSGYTDVGSLTLDQTGVWRGTATKAGKSVDVGLDYQGNVVEQ